MVWIELAESMLKDEGLNISHYDKQTRLINSLLHAPENQSEILRNLLKIFENLSKSVSRDFELKPFFHYSLSVFYLSEKQFRKLSEHC